MQHQNSDKQFGGFMFIDFFLLHILSYSCAKSDLLNRIYCITGQWQPCIVIVSLLGHKDVIGTNYILFFLFLLLIFFTEATESYATD
jgi:hypothetical protein